MTHCDTKSNAEEQKKYSHSKNISNIQPDKHQGQARCSAFQSALESGKNSCLGG